MESGTPTGSTVPSSIAGLAAGHKPVGAATAPG